MRDSLVLARNMGMDVFNALNLMENQDFLQVRGFHIGGIHNYEHIQMFLLRNGQGATSATLIFPPSLCIPGYPSIKTPSMLQTLKFGIGDGHLQYYLYNWRCNEITPEEVGLVLL